MSTPRSPDAGRMSRGSRSSYLNVYKPTRAGTATQIFGESDQLGNESISRSRSIPVSEYISAGRTVESPSEPASEASGSIQVGDTDENTVESRVASDAKLGTFSGVLFPCMQNILGILLFIRLPHLTGHAGVWMGMGVVFTCCLTTFLTSLSLSALATAGKVPAGGPYYIISRAMGPAFGGSVCFFFFLGTAVASSMYILGAVEVVQSNVQSLSPAFLFECSSWQSFPNYPNNTVHSLSGLDACTNFDGTTASGQGDGLSCKCIFSVNEARLLGSGLSTLMVLFVMAGTKIVATIAPMFLFVVLVAIVLIYTGFVFTAMEGCNRFYSFGDIDCVSMSGGFLPENLVWPEGWWNRWGCSEPGEEVYTKDMLYLFGLFFPSVTGIMAGCNRSGDLATPSRSIPTGTIAATLITSVIYLTMTFLWGVMVSGDTLRNEVFWHSVQTIFTPSIDSTRSPRSFFRPRIKQAFLTSVVPTMALFSPVVSIAILLSTVGAGIQSLVGAPKLLQVIASDRIIPPLNWFNGASPEPLAQHGGDAPSGGGGSGNRALLCTYLVSNLCILIGDLEAITPIITMFFLLCYMGINISCFVLTRLEQTSFRPTFKYYSLTTALAGAMLCGIIMFIVSAVAAAVSLSLAAGLYVYIERQTAQIDWGDAKHGRHFQKARDMLLSMQGDVAYTTPHTKNFRPQILLLCELDKVKKTALEDMLLSANDGIQDAALKTCAPRPRQHGSNEDSKMLLLPHLPDGSAYFVPTNPDLFAFSQQLKKGKGLLIVGAVVKGDLSNNGRDRKSAEKCLELCMRSGKTLVDPSGKHDAAADCDERSSDGLVNSCNDVATIVSFCGPAEFGGFAQVLTAPTFSMGASGLVQLSGLGALVPNTVLVGYPRTDSGGAEFSEVVSQVTSMGNSLCVVKTAEDSPWPVAAHKSTIRQPRVPGPGDMQELVIDIWWIVQDGGLLLLLPHLLRQHDLWKTAQLRVFAICDDKEACRRESELAAECFDAEDKLSKCVDIANDPERRNALMQSKFQAGVAWESQKKVTDAHCTTLENQLRAALVDLHIPVTQSKCVPAYETWWARLPRNERRQAARDMRETIGSHFGAGVKLSDLERAQTSNPDHGELACRDASRYARVKPAVELNQLMRSHSEESSAVFMALPEAPLMCHDHANGHADSSEYLSDLNTLTAGEATRLVTGLVTGLKRCVLIRGSREVVTEFI